MILSSNQFVDLPEGEHGPYWRRFSAARWASSASHLYGRPLTSTEAWTWLHSPSFRATPLDMKAEADRHFVEGINQLIGHGWPYSPPWPSEPGWRFYAAAALNDHNPWFGVCPISRYLQRVSFLLRQGEPANDVAIYLPTDDAWAHLPLGAPAVDETVDARLGPVLVPAILNAGYNFDFIDDRAMQSAGIPYKILILPNVERTPLATLRRLRQYTASGGYVIATESTPVFAPGLLEAKTDTAAIQALSHELFADDSHFARSVDDLPALLRRVLPPDVDFGVSAAPALGFVHRKLPGIDIYFLANSSNHAVETQASFRIDGEQVQCWDPFSGEAIAVVSHQNGTRTDLPLHLAPYESRVFVFSAAFPIPPPETPSAQAQTMDLSSGWQVTFRSLHLKADYPKLHSWKDDESTRFYSGQADYHRVFAVPNSFLSGAQNVILDFGPGTPVEPAAGPALGMRALLESPVHEAAVVFVNRTRAGSVWRPPYSLSIGRFLQPGSNELKITVGNTAMNEMAAHAAPDYRLLNLRYGERFTPQDVNGIHPLPSGITGALRLVRR